MRTSKERLRAIQRHLDVEPDGLLGPQTLTALEAALGIDSRAESPVAMAGLTLSREGIEAIVRFEIGSDNRYDRHLRFPHWPGGDSGVTIGIGYDLGYQSRDQFEQDWGGLLYRRSIEGLAAVCGLVRTEARDAIPAVRTFSVSLNAARQVFGATVLPRYARLTRKVFPGVENLPADAQAALVSLVFNRGASLRGDSRREMKAIRDHVQAGDSGAIAEEILAMRRLWRGRNLDGLIARREREAELVRSARQQYEPGELILV